MMIMRKTIFLIFVVLFLAIPASAVLNEKISDKLLPFSGKNWKCIRETVAEV